MRIVYMGSPDFAVQPLEKLVEAGHEVAAVFTQPDKPKNRGKQMQPTAVKAKALELGIPVYAPAKINTEENYELLRSFHADIFVVVAYGKLLKKEIFAMPPLGTINIHASLLPAYRGAAPIHWAVINGETESGVTIMYIDQGMDEGDMILSRALPIGPEENTGSLHDRLCDLGSEMIVEVLDAMAKGTAARVPQDHSKATYAALLTKELERLNWAEPAAKLHDLIRGLDPWPGTYGFYNGKRLKISCSRVTEGSGAPGTVLAVNNEGFLVACGDGALFVTQVQPEGKGRMDAGAFVRGYHIAAGDVLE